MRFELESDGRIDQSQFDFTWAGKKKRSVGLLEVLTAAPVVRAVGAVDRREKRNGGK